MIELIKHILGICPDHGIHLNLLDESSYIYQFIQTNIGFIKQILSRYVR